MNITRQEYLQAYRLWLQERQVSAANAGGEPRIPDGITPDEARLIREQVKAELRIEE